MSYSAHDFVPASDEENPVVDFAIAPEGEGETSWFDRFSVAAKLRAAIVSNALVLFAVTAVLLAGTAYLAEAGRQQTVLASAEVRTAQAAIAVGNAHLGLRDLNDRGVANGPARASEELEVANADLTFALTYGGETMPGDIRGELEGHLTRIENAQQDLANVGPETPQATFDTAERDLAALQTDLQNYADELHKFTGASAGELLNGISTALIIFVVLVLATIIAAFIGAQAIIRNVVGMIEGITDAMARLAKGETEASIPGAARGDEIGAMARALRVFREDSLELSELNDQRAQIAERELDQQQALSRKSAQLREEKSELLQGLADNFEVSTAEVISAVGGASEQLRDTSQTMVDLAKQSTEQTEEASKAMAEATSNVSAAAAATDQFALSIAEVSTQATASATLARDASELVVNANSKMTDLSSAADEIGEIAELIQSIAQRTNLLALNASIEAARGGEAGRGFAVVASEVKELASQTSNATSSVAAKITAMQNSTGSSVSDLTSIVAQIDELERSSIVIAEAVGQQSHAAGELARNIDSVAHSTSNVETRLEQLREASFATATASDQVQSSAQHLGEHAGVMRRKAKHFLKTVRRSASDLNTKD